MVAGSFIIEVDSPVEAKRLWNASVKDGHNLVPKQAPHIIESITFLQGDGGVGTVKQVIFTSANKVFSYAKERVEEMDDENFVYSCSVLEGGQVGKILASEKQVEKYSPKAGGGTLWTATVHYETLPGISPDEYNMQEMKDGFMGMFKLIEAYLLANPTLYC